MIIDGTPKTRDKMRERGGFGVGMPGFLEEGVFAREGQAVERKVVELWVLHG